MKKALLPLLALLSLAGACRTPKTVSPDYDATRQRANAAHQDLDQQSK